MSQIENNVLLQQFYERIVDMQKRIHEDITIFMQSPGISTALDDNIIKYIYADVLRRFDEFKNLNRGEIKYIQRPAQSKYKLNSSASTYAVLFDDIDKEFKLLSLTKGKFPDNTKRVFDRDSANKNDKPAYRIDVPEFTPYIELVIKPKSFEGVEERRNELQEHKRAVSLNNKLAQKNPNLFVPLMSFVDGRDITHIFAPHVNYDLHYILHSSINEGVPVSSITDDNIESSTSSKKIETDVADTNNNYNIPLNRTKIKFGKKEVEAWRITLISQLIDLVDVLHQQGICHRDIKPKNILCGNDLVNKTCIPKLIDLDNAKQMPYAMEATGTPTYMPPELYIFHAINNLELANKDVDNKNIKMVLEMLQKHADIYQNSYGLQQAINMIDKGNLPVNMNYASFNTGQHDIWSLGETVREILGWDIKDIFDVKKQTAASLPKQYGAKSDPLITLVQGLLNPDPRKRIDIQQAKKQMQKVLDRCALMHPGEVITAPTSKSFTHAVIDAKKHVPLLEKTLAKTKEYFKEFDINNPNEQDVHQIAKLWETYAAHLVINKQEYQEYDEEFKNFIDAKLSSIFNILCNRYPGPVKTREQKNKAIAKNAEAFGREYANMADSLDIPGLSVMQKNKRIDADEKIDENKWVIMQEKRLMMTFLKTVSDMAIIALEHPRANTEVRSKYLETLSKKVSTSLTSMAALIQAHYSRAFSTMFGKKPTLT